MFDLISVVPRPRRGQTLYCNCQKSKCFPCQNSGAVIGNTQDGSLQLCRKCMKEYETDKPTNLEIALNGFSDVYSNDVYKRGN